MEPKNDERSSSNPNTPLLKDSTELHDHVPRFSGMAGFEVTLYPHKDLRNVNAHASVGLLRCCAGARYLAFFIVATARSQASMTSRLATKRKVREHLKA